MQNLNTYIDRDEPIIKCKHSPMKILFICRGNVGRSQIAEAFFRREAGDLFEVISAGTKLSGPEQPIEEIVNVDNLLNSMKEVGLDISKKIRRQVTKEIADNSDKIILIVDDKDPIPDYLIDNPKTIRWEVSDLKGQSLESHRESRDQIEELVRSLIKNLKEERGLIKNP